jgi:hypothetical protein
VVGASLLNKPREVVHRQPRQTLVVACGGRDASHVGAAVLPGVVIITVGCGLGPLKGLLAPLFVAFDALLGAVGGDVRQHLLVTPSF